jgi:hypothetical protein
VVFVSVEEKPEESLSQITESLWNEPDFLTFLGNSPRLVTQDLVAYWQRLEDQISSALAAAENQHGPFGLHPRSAPPASPQPTQKEAFEPIAEQILSQVKLKDALNELWQTIGVPADGTPLLIVIDSLTALIDGAQTRFRHYSDRQMFLAVLQSFKAWRNSGPRPTVLFTAEEASSHSAAAESYLADVVIRLWRETKVWQTPIAKMDSAEWSEDLLFCKVLKGRGLPVQRRSCCYQFASQKGLHFLSTYAAQGFVSLFFENPPQRKEIKTFRRVDSVASYPGLIVQEFTRSGLQRAFAVRRHANHTPASHPLLLSNVDEYWVTELKRAGLLCPIPSHLLKLFSLPRPEGGSSSGDARVIHELAEAKQAHYAQESEYLAVPHWVNVGLLVYRKDLTWGGAAPTTWEDVESVCRGIRKTNPSAPPMLLFETRTNDTLMATALELGWSHGAFWHTIDAGAGELRIVFEGSSKFSHWVDAVERLHRWIHIDKFVPVLSSVDPRKNPVEDWAFARHWYSTWVDTRTRRRPAGRRTQANSDPANYGVCRIPISADRAKTPGAEHHSAWGEWYLAIQRGSENVELGVDLINNLMTGRKVTDRAMAGAGLPALEQFYKTYGENICPHTDLTFNEMRTHFFRHARTRAAYFDYRRVVRVISGALSAVLTNPQPKPSVRELMHQAFKEIDPKFVSP